MNPIGPSAADAELATAVAAGDRQALAAIFDRYAPRLLAFSQSMLHNRADAEDCLQNIFILAATRISGLREPDRLRSWLFAIARHECLRRLDRRTREVLVDAVPENHRPGRDSTDADRPADAALDNELAALLQDAIAGLADRDRLVLDLADRQGLATDEVAAALSMSPASTYKLLTRARATARKSIGALLVARTGRANCPELDALLGSWNGAMTPLLRKRVARHIDDCERCQEQERRVASPAALLGTGTAFAMPIPIRLRSNILDTAYEAQTRSLIAPPTDPWSGGWPPRSPRVSVGNRFRNNGSRVPALGVAAAVIAVLVIGALFVIRRPATDPQAVRGPLPAVVVSASTSDPTIPTTPTVSLSLSPAPAKPVAPQSIPLTPGSTVVRTTPRMTAPSILTTTDAVTTTPDPTSAETTPETTTPSSTTSIPSTTTPTSTRRTTAPTTPSTTTPASTTPTTSRRPTTPTTTTRTTPTTPTTKANTAPVITGMSIACQFSKASNATVPILTWSTTNTRSMDLSVDNPGVVGSYGTGYPSSGQMELPPNGCDPTQSTQIYTVYANGTDGTVVQRTINWTPPPVIG